jgi:molybdopterin-guanine dinucleotide biosynthesis protein B
LFLIVNIVGIGRQSGKTRVIQKLVQAFTRKHYNVSTIKHIFEGSFDTVHKDTWKHLNAGATPVIAISSNELVTINQKAHPSIEDALHEIPNTVQIVFVEGFKDSRYPKIVVARSLPEVDELMKGITQVIAISGEVASQKEDLQKCTDKPILTVNELVPLLERMIFENYMKILPKTDCKKCGYDSCLILAQAILKGEASIRECTYLHPKLSLNVDGKNIILSEFPKNYLLHTIMGMISNLKGVTQPSKISLEIDTN